MKRSIPLFAMAAAGLCASWSAAHPNPALVKGVRLQPAKPASRHTPPMNNPTDGAFSEDFESYAVGSSIIGQGGWEGWFGSTVPPDAFVSDEQAASGTKSLRETAPSGGAAAESDIVRTFNITGGKWTFKAKHFMPGDSLVGQSYFILLNVYPSNPNFIWSLDMNMNAATNIVNTIEQPDNVQFPGSVANQVPLVRDQWVDIRVEIDLDAGSGGRCDVYYNNSLVTSGIKWDATAGAAVRHLAALDLYSAGCPKAFFDDVSLEAASAPCYPDCNGDGLLNLSDFGCFTTQFALGMAYADCNGDGIRNLADFGCFTTKFALGCP